MARDFLKNLKRNEVGINAVLGILKQQFGEKFKISRAAKEEHTHTTTYLASQLPDAVIWPQTTQQVSEIVKICAEYKVPVIPFGPGHRWRGE